DAILFQRKAKELDFNVGALVGVSAGYSNPDLRDSIGDMVNGIFVSDFAAKVNPKALLPETVKIAEEFFKRYDDKMKRPPAGHASSSFSATWALFTEVLASTPAGCIVEAFTDPERDPLQAELFENPPNIGDGWLTLNDAPGLGLTLSDTALTKFGQRVL